MDEERFFAKTELSFVQNSTDLSKECEEKKFFGISGFRGFEKAGFFAYRQREIQNALLTNLENSIFHAWPETRAQAVTEDATSGGVVGRPAAHVEIA